MEAERLHSKQKKIGTNGKGKQELEVESKVRFSAKPTLPTARDRAYGGLEIEQAYPNLQ